MQISAQVMSGTSMATAMIAFGFLAAMVLGLI